MPQSPVPVPAQGARVRARGWGWRHGGRSRMAVSGLDLDIEPGERVLLLGASGAGKSTFVHALAGVLGGDQLDGDAQGELLIDGRRPADSRGRVGLVLQDPDSQVVLARVGDDVAFGCENLGVGREEIWRRVAEALEAVGLDLPLSTASSTLSGGQKQRLALAGMLAMRPGLMLLDEPTANLDPAGVIEVRDAVERSLSGTDATLIVIEHRVAVWRDVVNRVIVLDPRGGILADGTPEAVLSREGARLAAQGVWVPEFPPSRPVRQRMPAGGQPLMTTAGLCVGRTPFAARQPRAVAGGIDLEIRAGSSTMVTGANGAGKSTLALTLAGLLPIAGGELTALPALARGAGERPYRWKSRQLLTRIGTVFQDPEHQFLRATVRDELSVGPHAAGLGQGETAAVVDELLTRLHLDDLASANPFTLSGGEKRRLSVATVLATSPDLLVLDEPTFGQDSRTWRELVALLAEQLDRGTAVAAVTHDRELVEALADHELRLSPPPDLVAPVQR